MKRLINSIVDSSNTGAQQIVTFAAFVAGGVMLAMTVLVVVDVIMRYVFSNPIPGGTESTELLLDHIVLLGLAYGLIAGTHVRVTILFDRLPLITRQVVNILDCILGTAFFVILTYATWQFFWDSFVIKEIMMATVKLPYWVGKLAMPIGFFLLAAEFFVLLLRYANPKGLEFTIAPKETSGV